MLQGSYSHDRSEEDAGFKGHASRGAMPSTWQKVIVPRSMAVTNKAALSVGDACIGLASLALNSAIL